MKQKVFALVDCNNFFVSCERVFRPDLWDKPVVVLSNNDAVIVARSNEVKVLGVPMAVPYSSVKDTLKQHDVALFSANFQMYGDFSQRVVRILQQESPNIEVYSVDESFLEISELPITDYQAWARALSAKIFKWIGVSVSIGVASSKTLAKAAADYCKKHPEQEGAFSVIDREEHQKLLEWLPVGAIWGVGYRTRPKLEAVGIKNGLALSQVSDAWAQANLTIRGVRTVRELKGQSCIDLDEAVVDGVQKSILRSRSFGHTVRAQYELEAAIATFAAQIAAKLRRKKQLAGSITTFLSGRRVDEKHRGAATITLLPPTNDTGVFIAAALEALKQVYDPDFGYTRAGVTCVDLKSHLQQLPLGADIQRLERQATLMQTVDTLNARMGTRVVRHASENPARQSWFSKREQRSPAYTTNWHSLPRVKV